jgi:hypothetical protein
MIARRIAILVLACGLTASSEGWSYSTVLDGASPECGVPPDTSRPLYIIGYGSLMQDESRKRTSPQAGPAHPVEVHGYRRGWIAKADTGGFGTTFLGVRPDRQSSFNAVIYQVGEAELQATDRREESYCRVIVPASDIEPLEGDFAPARDGQTWIYVNRPERVASPSPRYPIVQSYVDIFVAGCLEQEQRYSLPGFSRQCLSTTEDWSEHWVNDRIHPRRPFVFQPRAGQIDKLLASELPDYFARIRLEGGGCTE